MTGINFDVTAEREAREQQKVLIGELNHRVKNTLAMIQSFASLTLKNSTPADFHTALMGRIVALSREMPIVYLPSHDSEGQSRLLNQSVLIA